MNTFSIGKESIEDPLLAGNGTVGMSEVPLSDPVFHVYKWIMVRADSENTGDIIVGRPGNAAAGYILHAGESTPRMYVDSTSKIAVVGTDEDSTYYFLGQ